MNFDITIISQPQKSSRMQRKRRNLSGFRVLRRKDESSGEVAASTLRRIRRRLMDRIGGKA
jgi:hypothetical protein